MPNEAIKKIKSALKSHKRLSFKLIIVVTLSFLVVFATLLQVRSWLNEAVSVNATESQGDLARIDLTVNQHHFVTEVARSSAQKSKGLAGRSTIKENEAMLFVYDSEGDYGFWMKDTLVVLDMIWVSKDKKIVHIEHNVKPDSYPKTFSSKIPAQYVLEIKGGEAQKQNIKEGDQLTFEL